MKLIHPVLTFDSLNSHNAHTYSEQFFFIHLMNTLYYNSDVPEDIHSATSRANVERRFCLGKCTVSIFFMSLIAAHFISPLEVVLVLWYSYLCTENSHINQSTLVLIGLHRRLCHPWENFGVFQGSHEWMNYSCICMYIFFSSFSFFLTVLVNWKPYLYAPRWWVWVIDIQEEEGSRS